MLSGAALALVTDVNRNAGLSAFFYPRSNRPLRRRWILAAATVSAQYEHVSCFLLYRRAWRAYKPFRAFLLPLISSGFLDKTHLENIRWHRRHGGFSIKEPVSKAQQKMVLSGPDIASNPSSRRFVIRRVYHLPRPLTCGIEWGCFERSPACFAAAIYVE